MHPRRILPALAAFAVAGLAATAARADAIDGNWCSADGRHFEILGPRIVTPAGTTTSGDYTRHSFSYKVPDGDPGAGSLIAMIQLNEQTLRLRSDAMADQDDEIWRRCELTS